MAEIYQDIARLRFGIQRVSGDGRFAVIVRCNFWPHIFLFQTQDEAQRFHARPCGGQCEHNHKLDSLKPRKEIFRPRGRIAAMVAAAD